jgi:hypothetical protein
MPPFPAVILRGNTTSMEFKGFAIQPLVFDGPRAGKRSVPEKFPQFIHIWKFSTEPANLFDWMVNE